jgi:cyclophilin family peptidyl-prolyl cis-trans isomerase
MMPILLLAAALAGDPAPAAKPSNPQVTLETTKGTIVLELYPDKAPKTVENFLAYVKAGHYSNIVFHRVIPGFMVQGGGMTADGKQKPTRPSIQNEADNGLRNDRGQPRSAHQRPHSASAQFFINTVNNDFLNFKSKDTQGWGYCVFGKVTSGLDVVDAISALGSRSGQPSELVTIKGASVKNAQRPLLSARRERARVRVLDRATLPR